MTTAQASIRKLYEQVRVLEAEAARPTRRRRLPHAFVLVAAVAIGVASASVAQPSVRREPLRAAAAVVHLIDRPAERARRLPIVAPHRARVAHRAATRSVHVVAHVATPSAQTAPAPASRIAPAVTARISTPPLHRVSRPRATARHKTVQVRPRPHLSAAPVGVGPVVVTASEEPQPDPSGATPTAP